MQELIRLYQQGESTLVEHRPDLVEPIRRISAEFDLEYSMGSLTRMIDRTGDGLGRIRQIVTDLRNFARLDEGETKESDLNTGIVSTVHIILGQARKRDVELKMDLTPLPLVLCNPMQINQVVLNLISNAIDASSRGGEVTIRTRCGEDGVEIHVLDSGQGIDPTIRHKIFDPFFTTKPVGQGTGLGLSISYGIVADHGGRIDLDTSPGAGAHFIVSLPLRPAPIAKSTSPGPGGRCAS
jgi:two-component system, NtrC family, sensor kinase